jgi:hypothetical protein
MKPRMQHADQRGQQHHVAEGTAAHCQRPLQTRGTGAAREIDASVNENLDATNSPNCGNSGASV